MSVYRHARFTATYFKLLTSENFNGTLNSNNLSQKYRALLVSPFGLIFYRHRLAHIILLSHKHTTSTNIGDQNSLSPLESSYNRRVHNALSVFM